MLNKEPATCHGSTIDEDVGLLWLLMSGERFADIAMGIGIYYKNAIKSVLCAWFVFLVIPSSLDFDVVQRKPRHNHLLESG